MTTTPPPIEQVIHSPPPIKRGKRTRSVIENDNETAEYWKERQFMLESGLCLIPLPDDEDTELAAIFGETMAIEPNKKYLCVREIKSAETELTDPIEPIDQIEYVSDIDPSEWHSLLTPAGNNENNETIATCLSILRGEEPSDN